MSALIAKTKLHSYLLQTLHYKILCQSIPVILLKTQNLHLNVVEKSPAGSNSKVKLISNLFNVNLNEAEQLVLTNEKITALPSERLQKFVQVLQRTNLKLDDVLKNPAITTHLPGAVEQHYYCLLDFGFKDVTIGHVVRYSEVIQQKCSDFSWNLLDSLVSCVDGPKNLKKIILKKYPDVTETTLQRLHRVVILEYLAWRLKLPPEDVMELVKKYLPISNRSVSYLVETCNILTANVGFTIKKIQTNAFLLLVSKENMKNLLEELPILAGIPIRQHVVKFPRVLSIAIDNVKSVEEILKDHHITQEQISKCGNIYCLKSSTIQERILEILEIPEFTEMKDSSRFLHLVYYLDKAKARLEIVKELGFTKVSVDLLTTSNYYFHKRLDFNGNRQRREEILAFLSDFFKMTEKAVRHKLLKSILFGSTTSVEDVEKTLKFLSDKNFGSEILGNLSVVLFDVELVEKELKEVRKLSTTKVNMLKDVLDRLIIWHENRIKAAQMEKETQNSEFPIKYGKTVALEKEVTLDMYLSRKRKEMKQSKVKK